MASQRRRGSHYSSAQTILVVGDGDMSFSRALAAAFGTGHKLVATSLDTYEALTSKYGQAKSNVSELKRLGATVLHCVDAGTMKHHRCLKMRRFDRIVFNFPHAGFIGQENDDHMIEAHQLLVRSFFHNASHLLCPDGEIHVSHKTGQPYDRWKIVELASEFSLAMFDTVAFRKEHYPGYNQKRGDSDRCNEEFSLHNGYTFKFRVSREEAEDCAQKDAFSTAAQRESLHRLQDSPQPAPTRPSFSFPPSRFLALVSSRPKSPIHLRSMALAEGETKTLTLKSSDGDEFDVREAVAMESQTIHHMIEDDCGDNGIPLPNVNSKIISKVTAYCNKHVHATAKPADGTTTDTNSFAAPAAPAEGLKNWDVEFVKVDQITLFGLILPLYMMNASLWHPLVLFGLSQAANYLSIKGLLDLTCQTVAGMIKGRTPEEMLKTFNIKNDFTPEEEQEIRREKQWAFE